MGERGERGRGQETEVQGEKKSSRQASKSAVGIPEVSEVERRNREGRRGREGGGNPLSASSHGTVIGHVLREPPRHTTNEPVRAQGRPPDHARRVWGAQIPSPSLVRVSKRSHWPQITFEGSVPPSCEEWPIYQSAHPLTEYPFCPSPVRITLSRFHCISSPVY